ncbi:Hypothetical predicted protein [Podarcis lilfordi]|uniref:C3H1-type domain-containing protein n=1 Tax=Podarcis lilfordi TaxID=74358 RepID=A0AA35PVC1_9SAUR|nr:Hypothetical predicted protein [Podarcis lilfordi]
MRCRPGVRALPAPPPASQDYIPDTLPSNQEHPSTSASGPGTAPPATTSGSRPLTRSQSSRSLRSKSGSSGSRAPHKGPTSTNTQQAIDVPSIFQDPPPQPTTAVGDSGSSSNEEHQGHQDVPSAAAPTTTTSEEQGGKRKSKKKHTLKKSKKSRTSNSEDKSGTSSSDSDSDAPMEDYWGLGEDISRLPLWVHERRANSHRKSLNGSLKWKGGSLVEDVKTPTNVSTDFILGNHLSQKKRTKILNGDYIDIFTLLPPTKMTGKGEKKCLYEKRRYRTPRAERTFENWLEGYQVFMGVVSAAYPKCAMHLIAHMAHVRRAFALAGENAALSYDEDFRRNASLLPSTRWDLRDQNYWMEHVGPYVEKKSQDSSNVGKVESKRRCQCWDFNRGVCSRTACKYTHECEKCLSNNPASTCFKGKQPFRGGREYSHQGTRGTPRQPHGTAGNRQ